ncbi:MAG: hypothetical protein M3276_04620 [Actinomycetota bacterium]|nr:hypothetical protein [Actinomycetota bacterium]
MHGDPATDLSGLVDAADVDALLLAVDELCARVEWDVLVDLARRCRDAVELGKQLWPVAEHIDYRLAYQAPARYAAAVLRPGAGRFALGPLTEVAASTHDWASLAPHLRDPASAGAVAQERVIRGEDLTGRAPGVPVELSLRLERWEPRYALPTYRDRSATFSHPEIAGRQLPPPAALRPAPVAPDDALRALCDVVETWTSQSSGRVEALAVEGPAEGAVGALVEEAAIVPIAPAEALALLQWAGASGGAYGRRRGGAAGRFAAWWAGAALARLDWPVQGAGTVFAAALGAGIDKLRWYRWGTAQPETGWVLRLAVADPAEGRAWALQAVDSRDEGTV